MLSPTRAARLGDSVPELEPGLAQLEQRAQAGAQRQEAHLAAALLPGLEHLRRCLAFREGQVLRHDQRMPQRNGVYITPSSPPTPAITLTHQ